MATEASKPDFRSWEDAVRWLLQQQEFAGLVSDCYYDQPAAAAARRYHGSAEWQAVSTWLPARAGRALDVGAGHGITSFALASNGWRVTALEPDPSELVGCGAIRRLAAETGVQVDVQPSFGESLPFEAGAFDLVFARQVLHHARDLGKFCQEMARVLRAGGTFVAIRDHVISRPADLEAFRAAHPLHRLYGGENAFTLEQYRSALQGAGFTIERQFGSFDSPVNYAPRDAASIARELAARLAFLPGAGALLRALFTSAASGPMALRALSSIDRRPGRLVSFVCRKSPGRAS
jgi:SAM-dependent methyltransferase